MRGRDGTSVYRDGRILTKLTRLQLGKSWSLWSRGNLSFFEEKSEQLSKGECNQKTTSETKSITNCYVPYITSIDTMAHKSIVHNFLREHHNWTLQINCMDMEGNTHKNTLLATWCCVCLSARQLWKKVTTLWKSIIGKCFIHKGSTHTHTHSLSLAHTSWEWTS